MKTYDVHFDNSENSNNKGFVASFDICFDYIVARYGSDESYFSDFLDGSISIVCNETGETVSLFSSIDRAVDGFPAAVIFENEKNYFVNLGAGMGAGVYPKCDFTLEQAISDQVNYKIE